VRRWFLALLLGVPLQAAPVLLSHQGWGGNAASAGINTTGATCLYVAIWSDAALPTFTDSKSNTWSLAGTAGAAVLYSSCVSPVVGSGHTVTTSGGSGALSYQSFFAFSGDSGPVDKYSLSGSNYTASITAGPITPSQNGALVISVAYMATSSVAVAGAFTVIDSHVYSGDYYSGGVAYEVQATAAAISATWNVGGATYIQALIADYPAASGAPAVKSQAFIF